MGTFTVTVESCEDGLFHTVVANGAGRKWISKACSQHPDMLGEAGIELAYYINEGNKLNPDDWVNYGELDLWLEKVADWTQDFSHCAMA